MSAALDWNDLGLLRKFLFKLYVSRLFGRWPSDEFARKCWMEKEKLEAKYR